MPCSRQDRRRRGRPRIPCRCRRSRSPCRRAEGAAERRSIRRGPADERDARRRASAASGSSRRLAMEVPHAAQHARGEVEEAVAQRVALVGVAEQRRGLRVDRDRLAAGGAVDARRDAVVAVARILGLDARARRRSRLRPRGRARPSSSQHRRSSCSEAIARNVGAERARIGVRVGPIAGSDRG